MNQSQKNTWFIGIVILLAVISISTLCVMKTTTPAISTSDQIDGSGDKIVLEHDVEIQNIPSFIHPGQVAYSMVFRWGEELFLVVHQPNMNIPLSEYDRSTYKWAGVVQSTDEGKTWKEFYAIQNAIDSKYPDYPIRFNVMGMFSEGENIFLDIADAMGAGSGEGIMTRLKSTDHGLHWEKVGCYYFIPENYYEPSAFMTPKGNILQKISPHNLEKRKNCSYENPS